MRKGYLNPGTDVVNGIADGELEGARRATGGSPSAGSARRNFTAKYKLQILNDADACTEPGQLGALLRREGLYSSNLTTWRRQRDEGLLDALSPKKRGRKEKERNSLAPKVAELERENERLRKKLRKAEIIIEVQKKISEVLGISQEPTEDEGGIS